jgi:hypothetical protein
MSARPGVARRLWNWLRADIGHVVIAAVVVGVPLYFVGVLLFDESTEDAARERAARENFDPSLTEDEKQFARSVLSWGRPEKTLPDGYAWCEFMRSDTVPGPASVSGFVGALRDRGEPGDYITAVQEYAASYLCADVADAWRDRYVVPDPVYGPDYEPPEPPERDWGPRG